MQTIKKGVKNFLVSLKYFFTPLGTIFLGLLLGLSVFIPVVQSALATLASNVSAVVEEIQIDPNELWNKLIERFTELDWSKPLDAVGIVFSREWLEETLITCLNSMFKGDYTAQIQSAVKEALSGIAAGFSVLCVFTAIAAVSGYFYTKYQIRKEIAKRAFWKFMLVALVDCIASLGLSVLSLWLAGLWAPGIVISSLLSFFIMGGISLTEAYVVHGWKKVKIAEIVTAKNMGLIALTNLIIFLIWAVFTVAVACLINVMTGLIISIVLLEIASIVISMNAESFVKDYAEKECENT